MVDPDNEATFQVCVVKSEQHETEIPKKAILAELKNCRYGEDARFAVKLALEEALTNAVKHGNARDPSKDITVRYAVTPDKAVIIVRDEGGGFIPGDVPDPTTPDRLPLPNGRGIMLMRAYMDEVVFRDHGREVRFVKHRKRPAMDSDSCTRSTLIRRTMYFSGRVQGVGFRFTAQAVASRFAVTGFVRNLCDGRVELVAEGTPRELARFQNAVQEAMRGYIHEVSAADGKATGEFTSFRVAF